MYSQKFQLDVVIQEVDKERKNRLDEIICAKIIKKFNS